MPPFYRILITSIDAFGHINCSLAFGELLKDRGHHVIVTNRKQYENLATKRGFEFIPFDEELFDEVSTQPFVLWTQNNLQSFRKNAIERYKDWTDEYREAFSSIVECYKLTDAALAKVLESVDVDLVIADLVVRYPSVYHCKVPCIPICSLNPLMLYSEGPPAFSGYSINVDKETAEEFRKVYDEAVSSMGKRLEAWLTERNVQIPPTPWCFEVPKYFGFYHYPAALDYDECGSRMEKWIRVDVAVRQPDDDNFVIPEILEKKPGKLIYFSLGSLGSTDVDLMRRLIAILAKSPHRFIVSKGPLGDEIDLPENMWGENYVNQIKALQVVDMVITHGGNNTIMETLYYGRPLIVIPFFFDQLDNAQRVVDIKIGRRIDFWSFNDQQLLDAIEETLADQEMAQRIKDISNSMKNTDTRQKAAEMIENLIKQTKKC